MHSTKPPSTLKLTLKTNQPSSTFFWTPAALGHGCSLAIRKEMLIGKRTPAQTIILMFMDQIISAAPTPPKPSDMEWAG